MVEQRYRAVLAVQRGEKKIDVTAQFGVSRQSVHSWCVRYASDGLAGLVDRSHRPLDSRTHQTHAQIEEPESASYAAHTCGGARGGSLTNSPC